MSFVFTRDLQPFYPLSAFLSPISRRVAGGKEEQQGRGRAHVVQGRREGGRHDRCLAMVDGLW